MQYVEQLEQIIKSNDYKPMTVDGFKEKLQITDSEEFKTLVKSLVLLEEKGIVVRTKKDKYMPTEQTDLIQGKVRLHKKGFAFVMPLDSELDDIFIPPTHTSTAMNDDIVLVKIHESNQGNRDNPEGSIESIVKRANNRVVGTYTEAKHFGFVLPDSKDMNRDVFIGKDDNLGAVEGHKVVVEITKYPDESSNPEGKVIQIIGHKNDPGVDILSIIHAHGINIEFPEEVMNALDDIPNTVTEDEVKGRVDLRDELTITIDGADAKDLDDAISVKKLDNGNYRLIVSIADVSHYVEQGSPIDMEAYDRATSVYLVDRVIPMLPHKLSNGICSLNPQEDRLAMSADMEINAQGKVISHEFYESVIHSDERMTYRDVNKILTEQPEDLMNKYAHITSMLDDAHALAKILERMRSERGSIDFDFKEAKVIVDEDGIPTDVELRNRDVGERLIESFMLCANECVAEHFHWMNVPFLYRVHEDPKEEKLKTFFEFITNFGIMAKGTSNSIHPGALQDIVDEVKGMPEELVISTLMLRSMQQARYDEESLGHFGLSTDFYTHFTSPIRRFPDLIVHRLIKTYVIDKDMSNETTKYWEQELPEIADHTSSRERRAVDAERATDELKKTQFMQQHIDEEFDGVISSIANFGVFVELPNTIEGMIHISDMNDDYYNFHERMMVMVGERTGTVYRIGDKVKVKCVGVNVDERQIDFQILEHESRGDLSESQVKQISLSDKKPRNRKKNNGKPQQKNKSKKESTKKQPFYKKVAKRAKKKRK